MTTQQQQDKGKGREIVQDGIAAGNGDGAAAPAASGPVMHEQPSSSSSSSSTDGQCKITFISLPVEVIERIIGAYPKQRQWANAAMRVPDTDSSSSSPFVHSFITRSQVRGE